METGGAGDGQSWAEQAEASTDEEWRRGRPTKHCRSMSRKREGWSTNPSPLQDSEGRHEAVQQLYRHADELTPACHDVAAQGMARHYPGMESGEAKSLNNQVLCMISEYHLTCLSQGSSCISPVLPEAAKDLLPPIEEYLAGNQGLESPREGQDPTGCCLASSPRHGCCWRWDGLLVSSCRSAWQGASFGVPPSPTDK